MSNGQPHTAPASGLEVLAASLLLLLLLVSLLG